MTTLAELRAKSQQNLNKLREKTKAGNSYDNNVDARFYSIQRGKDGNAFAIIRFLPISKKDYEGNLEEAMPWIKMYSHAFQEPSTGRWYIEKSLSTIGKPDPVYAANRQLYATKDKDDETTAKRQKRKLQYYSNIYVVRDPDHPENEGKVFLFKYGQKIHDKIKAILEPDPKTGDVASDPMDFDTGRDFRLQIRTVDDWPNYELATFTEKKPISDKNGVALTDKEVEKIWEDSYSLLDFLDAKEFKSYAELQKRFDFVKGTSDEEIPVEENVARQTPKSNPKPTEKKSESAPVKEKAKASPEPEASDIDLDALLADLDED
jgi:hypothetical protein